MRDLIIYGAGYPDIIPLIQAINEKTPFWNIKGFIDDTPEKQGTTFMDYAILGTREYMAQESPETCYINNVCSSSSNRKIVTDILLQNKCQLAQLIHPCVSTDFAEIGEDVMIADGVIVGANVKIKDHCAVRYNSVINHDNEIDEGVFIGPGATLSGRVKVHSGAYIGAGAIIKEEITIGQDSIVAAGAVVTQDVVPKTTVLGVPARERIKA